MNNSGHGIMVALVILATRGALRRSEGRAQTALSSINLGSQILRTWRTEMMFGNWCLHEATASRPTYLKRFAILAPLKPLLSEFVILRVNPVKVHRPVASPVKTRPDMHRRMVSQ